MAYSMPELYPTAQVMAELYKNIGIDVEIVSMPNLRAKESMKNNLIDADVGRVVEFGKDLDNVIPIGIQGKPLVNVTIDYYVLERNKSVFGPPEKWKNLRVGMILGCFICQAVQPKIPNNRFSTAASLDNLIQMLRLGRLDVILGIDSLANKIISQNLDELKVVKGAEPIATYQGYHWVNKKHSDLVPKIQKEFDKNSDKLKSVLKVLFGGT